MSSGSIGGAAPRPDCWPAARIETANRPAAATARTRFRTRRDRVIFIVISRNRAYLTLMRASRRMKLLAVAVPLFFLPFAGNGRSSAAGIAETQREILIVTPDPLDGRLDAA